MSLEPVPFIIDKCQRRHRRLAYQRSKADEVVKLALWRCVQHIVLFEFKLPQRLVFRGQVGTRSGFDDVFCVQSRSYSTIR